MYVLTRQWAVEEVHKAVMTINELARSVSSIQKKSIYILSTLDFDLRLGNAPPAGCAHSRLTYNTYLELQRAGCTMHN